MNKESIEQHGLSVRDAAGGSLAEAGGHPPGVYLFADVEDALALDEGVVFAVDVTGLALLPDPFFDSGEGVSFYSPAPLAPERVRFLCCTPDLACQHRAV